MQEKDQHRVMLHATDSIRGPSVGQSTVISLVRYLCAAGVAEAKIVEHTGVSPVLSENPDWRIPLNQYVRLWEYAIQVTGEHDLGLKLGTRKDFSDMGIVGHVVYNSEDLRTGLEQYVRLFDVVNDAVSLSFTVDDGRCSLSFIHKYPEHYCIPDIERSLVLALYRTRSWLGHELPLESVHLCHKPPEYVSTYRRLFGCPVYFNQSECRLVFSPRYLAMQPQKTNPYVRHAALQYANNLLTRFSPQSLADRVKAYIYREIEQSEPTVDRIASRLNMSKQTLYRKLKTEGLFFQKLVETVRFDKARQMLSQSTLSTSEIALLLGFSELSAFSRAFKRWSGMSPKHYRQSLLA